MSNQTPMPSSAARVQRQDPRGVRPVSETPQQEAIKNLAAHGFLSWRNDDTYNQKFGFDGDLHGFTMIWTKFKCDHFPGKGLAEMIAVNELL